MTTTTLRAIGAAALVACSLMQCTSGISSSYASTLLENKDENQPKNRSNVDAVGLEDARKGLITELPGLDYDPGFRQYSGYLTVSKEHGRNIFYWYIESENNPDTDPVVLWTNGGPGCSGFIGLAREHGPYLIDKHLQLSPNPYSWNKVANMLYIEQPAGVGFSYSTTTSDYKTGDHQAAADNYQVIRAFLERFPERQSNDFYISSESYGGHYMPQLALEILRRNTDGFIKFKGVMVGNPYVDLFADALGEVGIYYHHGLTPAHLFNAWTKNCGTPETFDTQDCADIMDSIASTAGAGINPYAIDYPVCKETTSSVVSDKVTVKPLDRRVKSSQVLQLERFKKSSKRRSSSISSSSAILNDHDSPPFLPPQDHYQPCSELHTQLFLNTPAVRKALHVDETKSTGEWSPCSGIVHYSSDDFQTPTINLYQELVAMALKNEHQLNIMVFSGDDDSVCATAGTQNWIWDLGVNATTSVHWEPWRVQGQISGYVTTFDVGVGGANLTFATVHGAGHEVPAYRPMEALQLFKNYFSGKWL